MKGFTKCLILVILLALSVHAVSAFSVSTVSIDPSGDLIPGTPVIVSFKIDFSASGGETFPSSSSLQMITDLEKPKWTWTLLLNGVENPRPQSTDKILELSGWDLSYPSNVDESIRVTLEGTIPSNANPSQNILKIQEVDSRNSVVTSTVYTRSMPVTPTPTPTPSFGSISVSSTPSGANIYLDNEYKGLTTLNMTNVANGNHVVLVRLTGYQDWTQNVAVLSNSNSLSVTLVVTPNATTTATTVPTMTVVTTKPTRVPTTIQTTVPTTEITTIPITSIYTTTTKPTTKATLKKITSLPTETPTQESPIGIEICLLALGFAALVLTIKR